MTTVPLRAGSSFDLHRVADGDVLGDDHYQLQPGLNSLEGSLTGRGRRDEDHRGVGSLCADCFSYRAVNGQPLDKLPTAPRCDTGDQRRASFQHPMGLRLPNLAGNPLDNGSRVLTEE